MPRMVGGVAYEHGHRMIAAGVGLLTIVLAIWTWRRDRRGWMRGLTLIAVLGVIFQGVLGGLSVLSANWQGLFWRPLLATAHGVVGQTMFCVLAAVALFTGRAWHEEPVYVVRGSIAQRLRLSSALLVIALIVWATMLVFRDCRGATQLRLPAISLHVLLLAQLILGVGAFLTRVVWHMDTPQPQSALVGFTVAHQTVGALLLAVAVVLAIQVRRAAASKGEPTPMAGVRAVEAVSA